MGVAVTATSDQEWRTRGHVCPPIRRAASAPADWILTQGAGDAGFEGVVYASTAADDGARYSRMHEPGMTKQPNANQGARISGRTAPKRSERTTHRNHPSATRRTGTADGIEAKRGLEENNNDAT